MMSKLFRIIPILIFILLAGLFYWGMNRENPQSLPTALANKIAPDLPQTGLEGIEIPPENILKSGEVTLVNFWASWCPPCRAEHPTLLKLKEQGIPIIGINMMDKDENAQRYIKKEGNPYSYLATDPRGRNRIEWGVTGPPETFIIRGDGTIAYRFIGPLVGSDYENRFLPELAKATAP